MSSGGPFLKSLAQARGVSWAKSWQWDSQFPTAPSPFNGWFPATEAQRDISMVDTHSFVGFGDTHDIPFASRARSFNVVFTDDDQGTLQQWFDDWIELYMFGRGQGTERLANIVRPCKLVKLDTTGSIKRYWSMQVYPVGDYTYGVSSESKFQSFMLSFRIAGLDNPDGT